MHMWGNKRPVKPSLGSKIDWIDPAVGRSIKDRARPAKHRRPPTVPTELEPMLVIGGTMMAAQKLEFGDQGVYPFPVLQRFRGPRGGVPLVQKGALLVYTGVIRSTERKVMAGRVLQLQVTKHTFVTPVGRCIIHDFTLIRPV